MALQTIIECPLAYGLLIAPSIFFRIFTCVAEHCIVSCNHADGESNMGTAMFFFFLILVVGALVVWLFFDDENLI